ncbi:MAG: phosphoenolpyruvate carboxylase [Bdellovibrio sp.]|nr:MAG: phosphoenolpyruvate carboxylase [Bdellovibrio sp.]
MHLPPELRQLVKESVSVLGNVIKEESGKALFNKIEKIRQKMAGLNGASSHIRTKALQSTLQELARMKGSERAAVAHSFSLMLELINACESAYRTSQLRKRPRARIKQGPGSIVYVLTAHPTEARNRENILIFQKICDVVSRALEAGFSSQRDYLRALLIVAWRNPITRHRKPSVQDEAQHVFSILLRPEILESILKVSQELYSVRVNSWVGGDKDGHPGVNAKVMTDSFEISRGLILQYLREKTQKVRDFCDCTMDKKDRLEQISAIAKFSIRLDKMRAIRRGDGLRVTQLKDKFAGILRVFHQQGHGIHPDLALINSVLDIFPGLVVPLELRETAENLRPSAPHLNRPIAEMLKWLKAISSGGNSRWYARSFVISQVHSVEDVLNGCALMEKNLGGLQLLVVPLFEQKKALRDSVKIIAGMLKNRKVTNSIRRHWNGRLEVMLGYSDSAKEVGVLASRIEIAKSIQRIDQLCRKEKITPILFHGSGGSVDRGGGSLIEQTAWWPASAFRVYKVTIQGEMVERVLSTPEIARGQIEKIGVLAERILKKRRRPISVPESLQEFGDKVAAYYQKQIQSSDFLSLISRATPYSFLSEIRIGSRPTKRGKIQTVSSLRAIPWVLCWTQTRVLFPTWWGIGSAWEDLDSQQKGRLRRDFKKSDFFQSYVKQLGFTLKKVDLSIFGQYLKHSGLPGDQMQQYLHSFEMELKKTLRFFHEVSGEKDLMYYRLWLGESISLRSPMINPLNLIQILAMEKRNPILLRETLSGIAAGMMTTG